ncbi:MAG: hypothetical protein HC895_18755 [Leptolyngbyaceae cyanobacterium SM1_3_5]|nr:hypothetical protein [Leptolyngbyaceae cyanobacterium SM1_3_5]
MIDESNRARSAPLFAGESEMKALVRSFDWTATPLGAIESWPQSLRTAASICLNSRFPMVLWWGEELRLIYNDAWRQILGRDKHPRALGSPGHQIWPENWDIIGAQLHGVLETGAATWSDDLLLPTFRYGYLEEAYYTYSYSPIFIETGAIGGVFTAVAETTDRVLGARRTATLRDLAAQTGEAKSIEQAYRMAIATLAENSLDIPFALLYRLSDDRTEAILQEQTIDIDPLPAPPSIDLTTANPIWPLAAVLERQTAIEVDNLRYGDWAAGALNLPIERAIVLPLWASGQDAVVGMLVAGITPARELDLDYRNFFEMTAGHIETAIANATAYEAERQRAEALAELDRAKTTFSATSATNFAHR